MNNNDDDKLIVINNDYNNNRHKFAVGNNCSQALHKLDESTKIYLKDFSIEILQKYRAMFNDPETKDSIRVQIGEAILNRVYGKAKETIDIDVQHQINISTDDIVIMRQMLNKCKNSDKLIDTDKPAKKSAKKSTNRSKWDN